MRYFYCCTTFSNIRCYLLFYLYIDLCGKWCLILLWRSFQSWQMSPEQQFHSEELLESPSVVSRQCHNWVRYCRLKFCCWSSAVFHALSICSWYLLYKYTVFVVGISWPINVFHQGVFYNCNSFFFFAFSSKSWLVWLLWVFLLLLVSCLCFLFPVFLLLIM